VFEQQSICLAASISIHWQDVGGGSGKLNHDAKYDLEFHHPRNHIPETAGEKSKRVIRVSNIGGKREQKRGVFYRWERVWILVCEEVEGCDSIGTLAR
jgi:hypothetical protein